MPQNDGGHLRRHAGLDPASILIRCRPWRPFASLDSGMRRNDDGGIRRNDDGEIRRYDDGGIRRNDDGEMTGEFAGMTTGEFAGFAGMTTGEFAGMMTGEFAGMTKIRRYDDVYCRRHTGLVPVSSQIACRPRLTTCRGRPWRLIIVLDSGIQMTTGVCRE